MRRVILAGFILLTTSAAWAQVSKTTTWTNPTQYVNGTSLAPPQIRETRISFSATPTGVPLFVEVSPGALAIYETLPIFTAGDWYVRAQTVDVTGQVSDFSNTFPFVVGACEANPSGCRPLPPTNLAVN